MRWPRRRPTRDAALEVATATHTPQAPDPPPTEATLAPEPVVSAAPEATRRALPAAPEEAAPALASAEELPTVRGGRHGHGAGAAHARARRRRRDLPAAVAAFLRSRDGLVVGVLAAVVLAAGAVSSVLPVRARPLPPPTAPPYAVGWLCPIVPGLALPSATMAGAAQVASIDVTNPGTTVARVRSTIVGASGQSATSAATLAGGKRLAVPAGRGPGYVDVEATGAPIVATGAAGCVTSTSDRWWLAAGDTRQGAVTSVVVANPNTQGAIVQIVLHTADGPLTYPSLQSLVVPAHSSRLVKLPMGRLGAALQPSIEVAALSGRVIVGGAVSRPAPTASGPAGGRATGSARRAPTASSPVTPPVSTALVAQLADAPNTWFTAGASGTASVELLVGNLGSSTLDLGIDLATTNGVFHRVRATGTQVLAGATSAIPLDLRGSSAWALRLSAPAGQPFVATTLAVVPGSKAGQSVQRLDGGVPGAQHYWIVTGLAQTGGVVLANPAGVSVTARVEGLGAAATAIVRIPAGDVRVVHLPGAPGAAVSAGGSGVIAGTVDTGAVAWGTLAGGASPGSAVRPAAVAAP